jgi:hypothetical protein
MVLRAKESLPSLMRANVTVNQNQRDGDSTLSTSASPAPAEMPRQARFHWIGISSYIERLCQSLTAIESSNYWKAVLTIKTGVLQFFSGIIGEPIFEKLGQYLQATIVSASHEHSLLTEAALLTSVSLQHG